MTNVPEVLLHYRHHEFQISYAFSIDQRQLSQKIRQRYWEYFLISNGIANRQGVNEILKLREIIPVAVDMDQVDSLFRTLLEDAEMEEKNYLSAYDQALFERCSRLSEYGFEME